MILKEIRNILIYIDLSECTFILRAINSSGNLQITTLFDSADHEKYKDSWSFRCPYWDDRIFSFDETSKKNTTFCNEDNR